MKKDKLIICRCEDITEDEIREAIRKGADNVDAIKRRTRAGMGLCQSRTCYKLIAGILADETGRPVSDFLPVTSRVPVRPVPSWLLKGEE
jgi:NAD(P)H-nitrite reductase large subunit